MCGSTGINVNAAFKSLLLIIFLVAFTCKSEAANPYKLGELHYFQYPDHSNEDINEVKPSFEWQEGPISANGQINTYRPPQAMQNLLENPTLANAKAYLAWQRLKIHKIIKAQEAVDQAIIEEEKE